MSERTYPYKAWVLTQGFNPKQVEVVKCYGGRHRDHDVTTTGKTYHVSSLYESRSDVIRAGLDLCDTQQADINKRQERLDKRLRTLEAATKKA